MNKKLLITGVVLFLLGIIISKWTIWGAPLGFIGGVLMGISVLKKMSL